MDQELDTKQTASLKGTLDRLSATLQAAVRTHLLKSDDERARLLADRVGDLEDEAVNDLIIDLDLAQIDRDLDELRDVQAALERMRQRTYGVCITCGGAISFDRLEAYPTAKRCVRCQRIHEKTYQEKSTPRL
ncbi:MAG TPA: TraR/DksA C4-type zinc finger protein [Steroidobacteraceae bacterium]|nr:TraR/DksA C4-type zinc finger protein [Steroidobacteraceae bacterium]